MVVGGQGTSPGWFLKRLVSGTVTVCERDAGAGCRCEEYRVVGFRRGGA
jgi:hypothetical protein